MLTVLTVTGKTVKENLSKIEFPKGQKVVRSPLEIL